MTLEDRRLQLVQPSGTPETSTLNWDWLAGTDAAFFQRPHLPVHLNAVITAKMMNQRVWVDWDDDLTGVPQSNPRHALYMNAHGQKALQGIAVAADIISVSTDPLAERIGRLLERDHAKIQVIPNACQWSFQDLPGRKVVCWRGSRHHGEHLAVVLPDLIQLARDPRLSSWQWAFCGEFSEGLLQDLSNAGFPIHPAMPLFNFMNWYFRLAPAIHIVPLADTPFNRCKSNLAWLEATAAGAAVLAPAWPEWQKPGVTTYNNLGEFGPALRQLMLMNVNHHLGCMAQSRLHVSQHLLLRSVNQKRWTILNRLWKARYAI